MFPQERLSVSGSSKLGKADGHPYDGKTLGKSESSPVPLPPGRIVVHVVFLKILFIYLF